MTTYLVTGAAGFIAARVIELLLGDGHSVIGVDNLNDAYDPRLKHWRLERLERFPAFRFHKLDVSDRAALETFWDEVPPVAAVINLAARAGVRQSVENPWVYQDTNVTGTLNLLEYCRTRNVNKFVLASTSSVYGAQNPMPYREDADTSYPLSPYAASKKAAEALCYSYHYLHGLDVTVLRYFTVYGPAGRPDMSVFRFVQAIHEDRPVVVFGDGTQSRDFTYVDDIARGTIAALKPLGWAIINLGSDRPIALMDMLHTLEKRIGGSARIEFQPAHRADMKATWASIAVARQALGWEPRVRSEEGLSRVVDWYQENRETARSIET